MQARLLSVPPAVQNTHTCTDSSGHLIFFHTLVLWFPRLWRGRTENLTPIFWIHGSTFPFKNDSNKHGHWPRQAQFGWRLMTCFSCEIEIWFSKQGFDRQIVNYYNCIIDILIALGLVDDDRKSWGEKNPQKNPQESVPPVLEATGQMTSRRGKTPGFIPNITVKRARRIYLLLICLTIGFKRSSHTYERKNRLRQILNGRVQVFWDLPWSSLKSKYFWISEAVCSCFLQDGVSSIIYHLHSIDPNLLISLSFKVKISPRLKWWTETFSPLSCTFLP